MDADAVSVPVKRRRHNAKLLAAFLDRTKSKEPTIKRSVLIWDAAESVRLRLAKTFATSLRHAKAAELARRRQPPIADQRKQSLYFEPGMIAEISGEAARIGQTVSATIRVAWHIAREQVRRFPGANP